MMKITRRRVLQVLAGTGAAAATALFALDRTVNPNTPLRYPLPDTQPLTTTPACADLHDETPRVTEGPFYRPNSPERWNLREAKTIGRPLLVEGRVVTRDCRPVAGAVLDFWSCDGNGIYDNDGFHLRGHQFSDASGAYRLGTIKPRDYRQMGVYRTPHIHVKVQGRETKLLTTQLFFPNEPHNKQDWFFNDALVLNVHEAQDGELAARFDFVIA
jgi:protocatechuate 3,4-dioxygenase beta subunit